MMNIKFNKDKRILRLSSRQAQSTLEYLIMLAVLIAIIVAVATTVMRPAIEDSMSKLGNAINTAADDF